MTCVESLSIALTILFFFTGGIPLTEEERSKLPRFVDCQKCNGGSCGCDKWSCPGEGRYKSQNCTCPKVGARTGWHPGL